MPRLHPGNHHGLTNWIDGWSVDDAPRRRRRIVGTSCTGHRAELRRVGRVRCDNTRVGERPDDVLDGGWRTTVSRVGDVLVRSPGPWSEAVVALLAHLESAGFAWSPCPIGSGFDTAGNETLSFIAGESPQPHAWSDDAAAQVGSMLRELHDATAGFVPPTNAVWQNWWGRGLGDHDRAFGHGDLGPWNIMAIDGCPTGFIDWERAGPVDPIWELAQAGWLNAQLHDDDIAERLGLGDAARRAKQLSLVLDGYGLDKIDRVGFVDKMVELAVHSARADAVDYNVTPDTRTGIGDDSFPFAWAITWRVRGASWMLKNRSLLERVIDP